MQLKLKCYDCIDGTVSVGDPPQSSSCTHCGGLGYSVVDIIGDELNDILDKCNDILNKCNDIFEKVNE